MTDLFSDFALPADTTSKCFIVNPATRKRLTDADGSECYVELHGYHSAAAQKWRAKREEHVRQLARELNDDENEDDLGDMLASLIVDWQLVAPNGKKLKVPCNVENAKKLFTSAEHRWLRQQVVDFLGNLGNFVPPGWLN